MRKLLLLLSLVSQFSWAALPLSFTSTPSVQNMAINQIRLLHYTIRNNLSKTNLPIQGINILKNDNQASAITSFETNCGARILAKSTCDITVIVNAPQQGRINRELSIDYGGRAPLTSPIVFSTSQAAYTILVYIVGSDLESEFNAASTNINQMKQIGSTANINIVIETGGANKTGWRTVQRKFILHNAEYLLQDLGNLNMGLQGTIESFFEWGVQNFPADKYIAIFWNHGGGPNFGYGGDEVHNDSRTPINQLSAAFQSITQTTRKNFEIIGFDTCFLGNIETFSGLYPYANYLVGSEDLEPGAGWQYNTFLNYVNSNPQSNGLQIGTTIVDGFTQQNKDESTTLSVISSVAVPNVISAINQFATSLSPYVNSNTTNWQQVARGRLRTPDYSTSVWSGQQSYDVADLTGLANGMAAAFPSDPAVQTAASGLISAVQNAVKYFKNSENRSASLGLTIYFPSILDTYVTAYPTITLLNGTSFFSTNYTNLITNYHNFFTANVNDLIAEPSALAFDGTLYTATVSNNFEENYASVGNDNCTNVFADDGTPLGTVPCYGALQSSGVNATPAGGNTWNISYNKATHASEWPLLNGQPIILIALDTEPVIPNEVSYLVPVTLVESGRRGFLSVIRNEQNNFEVVGFQRDPGTTHTQSKYTEISNGTRFYLRTYAQNSGVWGLYRTNIEVVAPFTITTGNVTPQFNAFRFLVADLTGRLNITPDSESY